MNECFAITPGRSIRPLSISMPRSEVWRQHRSPITSFYKTAECVQRTDDFTLLGIHVHYDADDCANYIEAHTSVQHNKVALTFGDHEITQCSIGELRAICASMGTDHIPQDFESGFEVPAIGLCAYSHDYIDDDSTVDAISMMAPTVVAKDVILVLRPKKRRSSST